MTSRHARPGKRRRIRSASIVVALLLAAATCVSVSLVATNAFAFFGPTHRGPCRLWHHKGCKPVLAGAPSQTPTSAPVVTPTSAPAPAPTATATPMSGSGACRYCSYFAGFSNGLPSSRTFFPIGIWEQYGASTSSSSAWGFDSHYPNLASAAAGMGINTFISENDWPDAYGTDADPSGPGFLQAACNVGDYVIAGGDTDNTAPDSVASVLAIANREKQQGTGISCSKYLAGYMIDDEPPECTTNVSAQVATVHGYDPTRIVMDGMAGGWLTWDQSGCDATADAAFAAPDLPASDDYHNTDPWNVSNCEAAAHVTTSPWADCSWVYGYQQAIQDQLGRGKPTEAIIEAGNDVMGFAEQNGNNCSVTTNACSNGNEYNATAPQVNADVWGALINGAGALEYFCDGTAGSGSFGYSDCLGGNGSASEAIFTNLKYIDHTVDTYAPELNTVSDGACTMQPSTYSTVDNALATMCSDGNLTISSSSPTEPIQGMTKYYDGNEYLFVMTDRANGATTGTYTVAGHAGQAATLVYDSAAEYDPSISEQGKTFTLNGSSQFSDSLAGDNGQGSNHYGAGANSYQVKIYQIS